MSEPLPGQYRRLPAPVSHTVVLEWLWRRAETVRSSAIDWVPIEEAPGRICATRWESPENHPGFRKAMMDGVAIRLGTDSGSPPSALSVVANPEDLSGAIPVATGSPVPEPWNCVVPVESLSQTDGSLVNQLQPGQKIVVSRDFDCQPERNIAPVGEDIRQGTLVLKSGQRIGCQHVGLLAALGCQQIPCFRLPSVQILVTGSELNRSSETQKPATIHDANGPHLQALCARDQGKILQRQIVPDDPELIGQAIADCNAELLLMTGGTSVGTADHTVRQLVSSGGLAFHGLKIRPGKPVAVGHVRNTTVFLLPGNPVACHFSYDLLVRPFLRLLGYQNPAWPYPIQHCLLSAPISSSIGRLDFLRVHVRDGQAIPITSGRASNLSTLALADGFILVEEAVAQMDAGQSVAVYRFDHHGSVQ